MSSRQRQHGAALMSILFLIVVIGVLGAFAIQTGSMQKQVTNLSLLEARANAGALMATEYVANRLSAGQPCPVGVPLPTPRPPGMEDLTFTIACPAGAIRDITVTARIGVFGDPSYVQRVHIRRVSPYAAGDWASPTQGRY